MDQAPTVAVGLTTEEWNRIVNNLAKEPYGEVFMLVNKILEELGRRAAETSANSTEPEADII